MIKDFPYHLIDLTHPLTKDAPTWNGSCGFKAEVKADYQDFKEDVKFRIHNLKMHAGIGTHMDAPSHGCEGAIDIDEIHLNNLIAPCVVLDVTAKASEDYLLDLSVVKEHELKYGEIVPKTFVMVRTGWEQYWGRPKKYHNNHHFPAVSREVAEYLLDKGIVGLGIDTLSPDRPDSGFPVHEILLGAGKYIIENAANLNTLPMRGGLIMALPLKIKGGTESPIRLVGLIPQ